MDIFRTKGDLPPEKISKEQAKLAAAFRKSQDTVSRIETLGKISDLNALKGLLDPAEKDALQPEQRKLVADHLVKEGLLSAFLNEFPKTAAALEAVRQIDDGRVLGDILSNCVTLPSKLRSVLIKQINEPSEISQALGNIKGKKLINRLIGEISPAMAEKMLPSADAKLLPLLLKRIDDEGRLKELAVKASPQVKEAAFAMINDKSFLKNLQKTSVGEGIGKSLAARLETLRPLYYEYGAHMDCPECQSPLILNGPLKKMRCDSCGSQIPIEKGLWDHLFRMSEDGGVFILGQRVGQSPGMRRTPHCPDCGAALDTDEIGIGSDSVFTCPSCKHQHLTFPAPKWLLKYKKESKKPVQVYCAEKEDGPALQTAERPRPIAFSCINCGGSLELNSDTPRIMVCGYCNTQQFLPGALWHALHPAKKIRHWYIRYE